MTEERSKDDAELLIDPDCRAGKHRQCIGGPCECPELGVHDALHEYERLAANG